MLKQAIAGLTLASALSLLLVAECQDEFIDSIDEDSTDYSSEMLLSRERRYFDPRLRDFKKDPKKRFQFKRVNVSLNQQSRFLTKFGPYFIKMHLFLDKGLERRKGSAEATISAAKQIVNYANTLLRPFNTYIMVSSLHVPSKHSDPGPDFPNSNIIGSFSKDYLSYYYSYMFEEVINCAFVFLGRDHMNYSISDSAGHPCSDYYGRPECKGFITLETAKPNYIKTAGVALAHELSHRLGAGHDSGDPSCPCEFPRCLMSEYVGMDDEKTQLGFTTCSINSMAAWLDSVALGKACLSAKWSAAPRTDGYSIVSEYSSLWGTSCGNGILEPGEECDCGGPLACKTNRCCDGGTCKLNKGVACGNGDCCNMTSCTPLPEGTICRPAGDSRCDFPETCDGKSSTCPLDVSVQTDWLCDKASGHRCRLGHCVPPRKGAKYSGTICSSEGTVPTTDGVCKPIHLPGPAEEWVEPSSEASNGSAAGAAGAAGGEKSRNFNIREVDEKGRQLLAAPWLVATSAGLLAALNRLTSG